MNKQNIVCIVCPRGCRLEVEEENGNYKIIGNLCKRGTQYGIEEMTNPTRVVTSTVKLTNSKFKRLPVVSKGKIPKDKMFEAIDVINKVTVKAPVKVGDIIIENILGLNVNIVSSRTIE